MRSVGRNRNKWGRKINLLWGPTTLEFTRSGRQPAGPPGPKDANGKLGFFLFKNMLLPVPKLQPRKEICSDQMNRSFPALFFGLVYVGCPPHANPSAESRTAVSKSATSSQKKKNETGE